MSRLTAVALALLVTLAAAAPAHGAARTRAAQEFSDAALRAKVALQGQRDELERRFREVRFRLCLDVIGDVDPRQGRRFVRVFAVVLLAGIRPLLDVLLPVARELVAELDAVPTHDRGLIAGRAGWRAQIRVLEAFPTLDRPCQRLDEWRDSGWRPEVAPRVPVDVLEPPIADAEAADRGLRIAQRRLRQLGVSRGAARRFTGATMFDGLEPPDLGGERALRLSAASPFTERSHDLPGVVTEQA